MSTTHIERQTDNLITTLKETIDELQEQIAAERMGHSPKLHTDYVLTRHDFQTLLAKSINMNPGSEHSLTITLHPEARMIVDLIVHADLTDPKGVMDARLNRLRVAIQDVLYGDNFTSRLSALRNAYHSVFVGS